jgi:hypothetical protein
MTRNFKIAYSRSERRWHTYCIVYGDWTNSGLEVIMPGIAKSAHAAVREREVFRWVQAQDSWSNLESCVCNRLSVF